MNHFRLRTPLCSLLPLGESYATHCHSLLTFITCAEDHIPRWKTHSSLLHSKLSYSSSSAMSTNPALPSFIELMASLGLDNEPSGPGVAPSRGHSRSTSMASRLSTSSPPLRHLSDPPANAFSAPRAASPAIVVSHHGAESSRPRSRGSDHESSGAASRRQSESNGHGTARYTPYEVISGRRGSMPSISPEKEAKIRHGRFRSLSSPYQNAKPKSLGTRRSGQHLSIESEFADFAMPTPISSLVRQQRRASSSPTSPTFSEGNCSLVSSGTPPPFPLTPVSIPTLPSLFPMIAEDFAFPTSDSMDETKPSVGAKAHRRQRSISPLDRHYTGLRLSSTRLGSPDAPIIRRRRMGSIA